MMRHGLAPLLLTIFALPATAADPVAVRELRTQKVGDATYFHVRLAEPRRMPPVDTPRNEEQPADAAPAEARLVSPDAKARHIYQRQAAFSSTPIPPLAFKRGKEAARTRARRGAGVRRQGASRGRDQAGTSLLGGEPA